MLRSIGLDTKEWSPECHVWIRLPCTGIYNPSVGLIIDDCGTLIRSLSGCGIVHLRRSVNQVAHYLAKAAAFGSEMGKWRCSPPSFLDDVSIQDLII